MSAQFEIKHINGVPYYLHESTIYTFELDGGKPSSSCTAIGTYDGERISYYPEWRERVAGNLQRFRDSLFTQERDKLRDTIVKPAKQRKSVRNPRKSTRTTKSVASE